ncbi:MULTISPECIES: NAD(+) diphosphatase [unclassified Oceanispirochaeta]|uniref:NAD(+) diphosphatase n=1 Tax=unclassified Oceanispirochaeta TaxID=2635722 RepID=UPI0013143FAE|nr:MULTISPECIES: NAD(+) diphosphatase [unclassified Oceanispirochaeta]MBF9017098.1 NAD(+) diphosphatase [Oceanispirochaeta sp. M2]NPD73547.1 NAD(+) diphosphatase [Oceanispirochaeta sp. M1]
MKFIPGLESAETSGFGCYIIFSENERSIAVNQRGIPFLDSSPEINDTTDKAADKLFIGTVDCKNCTVLSFKEKIDLPSALEWTEFITVFRAMDGERQFPLSQAKQLLEWSRTHRFCGACAARTVKSETENAYHCPDCKEAWYPVIAPAVITRITRGDEILLAHNVNFPEGLYSHVAGFVDPGENLEQTVRREVMEEVGLEVENLRFFDSQSWPMPHSLMLAFTAECTDPDAVPIPDGKEIDDAKWFTRETMPEIPSTGSIAGRMLMDYRDRH